MRELGSSGRIKIRLDRVGLLSSAPHRAKPVSINGFEIQYDRFVRPQGKIATYARARSLQSTTSGTRIAWQYGRKHGWLKPWRIVVNGDDQTGITPTELRSVLRRCRHDRLVLAELAIDFLPNTGVNRQFVLRHGRFGKSRRDTERGGAAQLRYGTRKSMKLVRCYWKDVVGAYRVELELHSGALRKNNVHKGRDVSDVALIVCPRHFRFVTFRWRALRCYLEGRFSDRADRLMAAAHAMASVSISKATRYLQQNDVLNVHRFLKSLSINRQITRALVRWAMAFKEGLDEYEKTTGGRTKSTNRSS